MEANVLEMPGVVGDGVHDDTSGIQAALDGGASTIRLPKPSVAYLVSRTLVIHSRQTIVADRNALIRLADGAKAHLLTNDDHEHGNERIAVFGGIWDGNNEHQGCEYHDNGGNWRLPYDPARYLGVLFQFNRVTDLLISDVTLKDPETFGIQIGNIDRFTIERIIFDYNLLRGNMDGVHVHGNSRFGRIADLKGTTNDDLVALNADDGSMFEMSRGPITDIVVDGVWSEDGYTAVRLLSAGSPIRRVRLLNIFGTYRFNIVSFTNHRVHPGEASTFEDVTIEGVRCAKSSGGFAPEVVAKPWPGLSPIWIDAPAAVSNLSIRDYRRTETEMPASDIRIESGVTIDSLSLSDVAVTNRCGAPFALLHNLGQVEELSLSNVRTASDGRAEVEVLRNEGAVGSVRCEDATRRKSAAD